MDRAVVRGDHLSPYVQDQGHPGEFSADIAIDQGRVYHPLNYDRIFRGLVSVGDALGSSMNVPAVRALGFGRLNEDEC